MCGLNVVGLRRAGFSAGERLELKQLYKALFRSEKTFRDSLDEAKTNFSSAPAKILLDFVTEAKRGIVSDIGKAPGNDENE
jgi:UDP-N-acetylglucosamine acyltransferase